MNPLVQSFVERFSESTIKTLINADGFANYASCLPNFWSGHFQQTIDETSGVLTANPNHPMRFALYRLWIEALTENNDDRGLRALEGHLMLRGASDDNDRSTYMALRGLIHIALDRPNAAKLMLKAVGGDDENCYAMELATKVLDRNIDPTELPALINSEKPFADYVTWQSLVRSFVAMNQRHRAEPCLDLVERIFAGNPMRDLCYFHWSSDIGDWNSAFEYAERLAGTFPGSQDFTFYAAHAALRLNRFNQTIAILEKSKVLDPQTDPDAALIMGQAVKAIGMQRRDVPTLRVALGHLERASKLVQMAGHNPMPAELLMIQIREAINEFAGADATAQEQEPDLFRPTQAWLVKLSHRRYLELKNSKESHVSHLTRPMGSKARPGDLCFFAVEGPANNRNTWKIAAIYTVESEPVWHPSSGHQSALQLIAMPKRLIPVAVQMAAETNRRKQTRTEQRTGGFQNGVFQLEEGVLDLIQEAIRQHQASNQNNSETLEKSKGERAI